MILAGISSTFPITSQVSAEDAALLEELATSRAAFCETKLMMPESVGKHVLHLIISGGSVPENLKDNVHAEAVARLARWLRWLACTMLPEVHSTVRSRKLEEGKSPEASTFATWWQSVECHIMDVCMASLANKKPDHLSLHFDGVRISKARG